MEAALPFSVQIFMEKSNKVFVREATGLTRSLSPFDSIAINVESITIGTMFFGLVFIGTFFGTDISLGFLLATALSLAFALLYSTFSTLMPKTGGDYVWVSRIIHPSIGFALNLYISLVVLSWPAISGGAVVPAFMSTGLTATSIITGNSWYANLTSTLNQPWVIYAVSALPLVLLLGTKTSLKFIWAGFIAGALAVIITIGTFLFAGHSTFISNYNAVSSVKYDAVITSATAIGFAPSLTLLGVFAASVFALFNSLGYNFTAYYVGEVQRPNRMRTQLIAQFGALLIFALLGAVLYSSLYSFVGRDFVNSVLFLFNNSPSNYPLPFTYPLASAYLAYATNIVYLPLFVNTLLAISYSLSSIAFAFVIVRNFFAWSFDRVLPMKLADIDQRGTPWCAILIATVISEIYAVLFTYTPTSAYMAYEVTGFAIVWGVVAVAAIVFPYFRKEMFESLPGAGKGRILGTYKITIVGIIGVLASAIMIYASLSPSYVGALNPAYMAAMIGPLLAGIPIFFIAQYVRGKQGINIALAYKALPPE
ncbi:MAG: APC family permease [Candidatus Bathyarchaeia archaeon]